MSIKYSLVTCHLSLFLSQPEPVVPRIPPWEHLQAKFDLDYTEISKNDNAILLINTVKEHLDNYKHDLRIYSDGSVLDSNDCGSGYVILDLKIYKSYYISHYSHVNYLLS